MMRRLSKALEIASFVIAVVIGLVGAFMLVMALICCVCPPTNAQAIVSYDVTLYSGRGEVIRRWEGCDVTSVSEPIEFTCDGQRFKVYGGPLVVEYHEVG